MFQNTTLGIVIGLCIFLSLPSKVHAATKALCSLNINHVQILKTEVSVSPGTSAPIAREDAAVAKLHQISEDQFEIDVFSPQEELRFYANGPLTGQAPLTASLWTRSVLLEVRCQR